MRTVYHSVTVSLHRAEQRTIDVLHVGSNPRLDGFIFAGCRHESYAKVPTRLTKEFLGRFTVGGVISKGYGLEADDADDARAALSRSSSVKAF